MRLYATFYILPDNTFELNRIGLNKDLFSKGKERESTLYFQDIDPETQIAEFEHWKPYNGICTSSIGWIDTLTNKYMSSDQIKYDSSGIPNTWELAEEVEIYKDGELVNTEIKSLIQLNQSLKKNG